MSISFSRTMAFVSRVFIASLFLAGLSELAATLTTSPVGAIQIAAAQSSGDKDTVLISHRRHRSSRLAAAGAEPETVIVDRGGKRTGVLVDSGDGGDIVRMGDDIVVEKDEVVGGDAVSIGGSVTVLGKVSGDAVAIGGDVSLGDSAAVGGDAVSIGGGVSRSPGAKVGGQVVNVGVSLPFLGKHIRKTHSSFLDFVRWLIFYLVVFAAAALCITFAKDRIAYAGVYLSREPILAILLGVFSPAMMLIAAALLCITLIGIPVAVLLVLLYPVLLFLGWVVTGQRLGSAVNADREVTVRTVFTGLVIISGLHILGVLFRVVGMSGFPIVMLSVLGFTISFTAALVGLGAMLGTRFRRPPETAVPVGYSPSGPPTGPTGPLPQAPVLPPGPTYTPPAVTEMSSRPAGQGTPEG